MQKYLLSISVLSIALIVGVFLHTSTTNTAVFPSTQIIGDVPTDYETEAFLDWTGGTLYQLKARLQTLGCTADFIVVYDPMKDRWFRYSQYSWRHSFNQEFHDNYPDDYIPPSRILIPKCYDMCEFEYTREPVKSSVEEYMERRNIIRCSPVETSRHSLQGKECNQNWDRRVIEHVFPIMPVMKDLCIFRTGKWRLSFKTRGIYNGMSNYHRNGNIWISREKPFVVIHENFLFRKESFYVELHEVCHSQQEWYVSQIMYPHEPYIKDINGLWNSTPAGQALIRLTGYQYINSREEIANNEDYGRIPSDWSFPRWLLKTSSPYYNIYSPTSVHKRPTEVAAELCATKLYLDITGRETIPDGYSYDTIKAANQWLNEYVFVLE